MPGQQREFLVIVEDRGPRVGLSFASPMAWAISSCTQARRNSGGCSSLISTTAR
jgi:hypothetical protein